MVDSISSTLPTTQTTTTSTSDDATSALSSDFETFLTMLTVQVQNQDPLNPLDASEYASQLATFSGVEQQVKSNELLESISSTLAGNALNQLGNWIGKEGLVAAPARFDGQPIVVRPEYAANATSAILSIVDANGVAVDRVPFAATDESYVWDGLDSDGNPLPSGVYEFQVESYDAEGLIDTSLAQVYSRIDEVRNEPGGVVIRMSDGTELGADEISGLRAPSV